MGGDQQQHLGVFWLLCSVKPTPQSDACDHTTQTLTHTAPSTGGHVALLVDGTWLREVDEGSVTAHRVYCCGRRARERGIVVTLEQLEQLKSILVLLLLAFWLHFFHEYL